MGEAFIVRKGGVTSEATAAPTITIVSETATDVTFTLTNNDDNTAVIVYEIDTTQDFVELAAAATSSNITVALAAGTYTLTAFATVVGEVASSATTSVLIELPQYEELFSTTVATAVTEIDITGLSIGKDDTVRIVFGLIASNTVYFLRVNDITTNYSRQLLRGDGSSITAFRSTTDSVFAAADSKAQGFVDIKVSNNDRFVYQSQYLVRSGSESATIMLDNQNGVCTSTVSTITKLSIVANSTNGIGVNSKITLYKVTEAA